MDGIIILNKEKNWTSNDVVQKVKKIANEKVGHTGTLDPMATGVLPLLIGKGTKLSKYLINHNKEYVATIKLGIKTTTGDLEGEIVEKKQIPQDALDENNVKQKLKEFIGHQKQVPPMYSAIKVNGKKLYEYARKGKKIDIEPRNIEIFDIQLIKILREENEIVYKVKCSKGTYIRSLCEDISLKLGTVGFMKELERTQVGDFYINQAIKISEIVENQNIIQEKLITIEKFFLNKEKLVLSNKVINMFLNGIALNENIDDGVYRIYDEKNKFVGTGIIKNRKMKRDIIV